MIDIGDCIKWCKTCAHSCNNYTFCNSYKKPCKKAIKFCEDYKDYKVTESR